VERLQEYRKRLILFPRRNGKTKNGDASAEDVKAAKAGENLVKATIDVLPIKNVVAFEEGPIGNYEATENAYKTLRENRSEARYVGVREKRAKAKTEEEKDKKK
jgi:large subunit ribosomal protein L13e